MIKHNKIYRIALYCLAMWHVSLIPAIARGTKVVGEQGPVAVEELSVDTTIAGYDPISKSFLNTAVKDISSYITDYYFVIETGNGPLCATTDQVFYDVTQNAFVSVEQLSKDSIFFTRDLSFARCTGLSVATEPLEFYDITLEKPHLFFSGDAHILTHNFVPAAAALYPLSEWVLGNVIVIACTYLGKPHKYFTDFEQAKKQVLQECIAYAHSYDELNQQGIAHQRFTASAGTTKVMGVQLHAAVYNNVMQYPFLYGPICATVEIQNDGDFEITLHIYGFAYNDGQNQVFGWTELGKETVRRDHQLIKFFIETEDRKQLNEMRDFIKKSPYTRDKIIYGNTFSARALTHMVEKNIPPSLVLHAMKYGVDTNACDSNVIFCLNYPHTIAVLFDCESGKIIDVGYDKSSFGYVNQQKSEKKPDEGGGGEEDEEKKSDDDEQEEDEEESSGKTVEYILDDAEPGDKTGGNSTVYVKPGDEDDANDDFDALDLEDVKDKGNGIRTGVLPDGRIIVVRPGSSGGRDPETGRSRNDGPPTLEIQGKDGKKIKVRYVKE